MERAALRDNFVKSELVMSESASSEPRGHDHTKTVRLIPEIERYDAPSYVLAFRGVCTEFAIFPVKPAYGAALARVLNKGLASKCPRSPGGPRAQNHTFRRSSR